MALKLREFELHQARNEIARLSERLAEQSGTAMTPEPSSPASRSSSKHVDSKCSEPQSHGNSTRSDPNTRSSPQPSAAQHMTPSSASHLPPAVELWQQCKALEEELAKLEVSPSPSPFI